MKYFILLTFASAIAALDQATKLYIHTHFALGESLEIIPKFFSFTYVRNSGGAFGLFRDSNEVVQTILFLVFPFLAFIFIFSIVKKLKNTDTIPITALSFICGGAIGNLIDRIHFKYVIDFLDIHTPGGLAWPTFNLADSFIVVGVALVGWLTYKYPDKMPI